MTRDAERPCFERFVAGIPGGLDAHPGALAKGSLVRSVLLEQPRELLCALPPPLRPWAEEPPLDTDWVGEARLGALIHAVAELRGWDVGACLEWTRRRNLELLSGPLYRLLMIVATPAALLRHAPVRWANFHRGSTLAFLGASDDGVRISLTFPAGVFDALLVRLYGAVFAAALELANAPRATVEVEHAAEGFARYRARW